MKYVTLTFDDALDVHLDRGVPALDSAGLKGTFYTNIGARGFTSRLFEWQQVARNGHELGNHSVFHPAVLTKAGTTEGTALEHYSPDRMRAEIRLANQVLEGLDGMPVRSFAYPGCNPVLGRPGIPKRALRHLGLDRTRFMGWLLRHPRWDWLATERSYSDVVSDLCIAARAGGNRFAADDDFPPERFLVPCVSCDGQTADGLRELLQRFRAAREGWLVLMFHGIGGGHRLSCEEDVFLGLLAMLQQDSDFRVDTFRAVAAQLWGAQAE